MFQTQLKVLGRVKCSHFQQYVVLPDLSPPFRSVPLFSNAAIVPNLGRKSPREFLLELVLALSTTPYVKQFEFFFWGGRKRHSD